MTSTDPVWYENVGILSQKYDEFFPTKSQSDEERLNSMVRLIAYASVAVYVINFNVKYLAFGLISVALLTFTYKYNKTYARDTGMDAAADRPMERRGRSMTVRRGQPGERAYPTTKTVREPSYANLRPKDVRRARVQCSRPSADNPFSNMTVGELVRSPGRAPACSYDDAGVAEEMRRGFNRGLFRNLDDVYEVENSQRQFYTLPVTTSAPDTIAFAQFCYGTRGETCKETPWKCEPAFATRD